MQLSQRRRPLPRTGSTAKASKCFGAVISSPEPPKETVLRCTMHAAVQTRENLCTPSCGLARCSAFISVFDSVESLSEKTLFASWYPIFLQVMLPKFRKKDSYHEKRTTSFVACRWVDKFEQQCQRPDIDAWDCMHDLQPPAFRVRWSSNLPHHSRSLPSSTFLFFSPPFSLALRWSATNGTLRRLGCVLPGAQAEPVLKRLFEYSNIFEQGFQNEYSNTKIENRVFEKVMNRAPSRWAYRGLISATMFRGPVGIQPPARRTHVTPRNGWQLLWERSTGPRSTCSAGAGEEVSPFYTSLLWLCHLSLSLSFVAVVVVEENDSLSFFFQTVTDRCAPAFGAFFTGSRSEEESKAPKRMVLKIDRRRVVLLSFFSPGTACNSSWRHSLSHAKPCWLVAAIHPESTTNWPETKAIEHAPPFTGHEQGGRDFDFGNVSSPRPLIWLPSCFAKQQSGHSSVIVWFCFFRKSPQKKKKNLPEMLSTRNATTSGRACFVPEV